MVDAESFGPVESVEVALTSVLLFSPVDSMIPLTVSLVSASEFTILEETVLNLNYLN